MTTLVSILIASAFAIVVAWAWTSRSLDSMHRIVLIAMVGAFAVAGRLITADIPGLEPITLLIVCVALMWDLQAAVACAIISVLLVNTALGHGPWTVWQITGFIGVAVLATAVRFAFRRASQQRSRTVPTRAELSAVTALCAMVYDLYLTTWQWATFSRGVAFETVLAVGAPMMVIHVAWCGGLAYVVGQPVCTTLQRAYTKVHHSVSPAA